MAYFEWPHLDISCLQIQLFLFLALLSLQCRIKIAADDIFKKTRLDISCESCLAEDSHEISSLIFSEKQ